MGLLPTVIRPVQRYLEMPECRSTTLVRLLVASLLVALLLVAACGSNQRPEQPAKSVAAATRAQLTATRSITLSPTPAGTRAPSSADAADMQLGVNIAALGDVSASSGYANNRAIDDVNARLAVDGDLDTIWSSEYFAPQWFTVTLDGLYLVDRIQLVVSQAPAGPTTHEIWLGNESGARTLYTRLENVYASDGQTLDVPIDPPRNVSELYLLTVQSPSWVAWREIRIFGSTPEETRKEVDSGDRAPLTLAEVARGFELPVQITHAGDGSGRVFVVEQTGRIHTLRVENDAEGRGSSRGVREPFLDISGRVICCGERGLLNVAFPPAYAAKKRFYVSYTNARGATVVSRFHTTPDPDVADPDSEQVLLVIDQPERSHNGGRLAFGPKDGFLYIGSGDGGKPQSHAETAQDPGHLLGKILRIDVESVVKPYRIPPSNPFLRYSEYRREIWALGLRNPWGFAFDDQTGSLYIPDAGHFQREEVNFQPASSAGGENYGWFLMEANRCFLLSSVPCRAEGFTSPVAEYNHAVGCAIVGGIVYRGQGIPELRGAFLFSDFCSGRIWALHRPETGVPSAWESTLLINAAVPISSIGEDEQGNAYVLGYQTGTVSMIMKK